MKKFKFSYIFEDNGALWIFSIAVALLCWLGVQMTQSIIKNQTIHDVPVSIDWQSQNLTELDLSIIDGSETTVSVTLRGPTTVVGQLKPENLLVIANIADVSEPGNHDLTLTVANVGQGELDQVEVVSFSPSTVRVRLDRLVEQTFDVEPVVRGLSTPPGYMSDEERVTPSTITVRGPEADLERIDRVVVEVELSEPLERSFVRDELPIMLLNAQGDEIDLEAENIHLTMDTDVAQLTIRILRIKTLPLIVGFTGIPQGNFPLDELAYHMILSADAVQVAGPVDTMDKLLELYVGYVDVRELDINNSSFVFSVELPSSSMRNIDNIDNIGVEFNTEDWDTMRLNVSRQQIQVINDPPGYNVSIISPGLNNIALVGNRSILSTLTSDDIVVTLDLSEKEITTGQYNYPAKISLPTKGLVWATGEYSVIIQVTE